MSSEFPASDSYFSPTFTGHVEPERERAPGSLLMPAMALIAVAVLGLACSGISFLMTFGEAHVDPTAPPLAQDIQRGAVGPMATALQGGFILLNVFIIICSMQMMKLQNWGLAVAGSCVAMINLGSCCCVLGIPVGLWSLSVLFTPDIMTMFRANQPQQI
jgi:hypothetical protein